MQEAFECVLFWNALKLLRAKSVDKNKRGVGDDVFGLLYIEGTVSARVEPD